MPGSGRVAVVAFLLLAGFGAPAMAESAVAPASTTPPPATAPTVPAAAIPDAAAWQNVITGQIEAFRKGDAATAFSLAGAPFQKTFTDPAVFMMSIAASGYTPIFTSVSHTFGKFSQPDATTVVQEVTLMGPKQEIYDAVYALTLEAAGWRVQGVQLMKEDAIGV